MRRIQYMQNLNKQIKSLEEETIQKYETIHLQENLPYTPLKGNYLYYGEIILHFINYYKKRKGKLNFINNIQNNLSKNFFKKKYNSKSSSKKNEIHFKSYYSEKLDKLIFTFMNIVNGLSQSSPDLLNNIEGRQTEKVLEHPNILNNLNDFMSIRHFVTSHYVQITMLSQLNFYTKLIEFIKNLEVTPGTNNKDMKNNLNKFSNFKSSSRAVKKFINQITYELNHKNKFFGMNFDDFITDNDRKLFETDINNLLKICIDTPSNEIPKKLRDYNVFNTSYLLVLYTDEFLLGQDVFLKGELRNFIKKFYFLYIMKKYNFISKTDDYYSIDIELIRKELNNLQYDNNELEESILKEGIDDREKIRVKPDTEKPSLIMESYIDDNIIIDELIENDIKNDEHEKDEKKVKTAKTEKEKSKSLHYSKMRFLYNGEYDNTTYLFNGYGNLIDIEGNNCYEGMFRYGYKHGIGIFWQDDSPNDSNIQKISYYSGEWLKDTKSGYGIEISIQSISSNIIQNRINNNILIGFEMKINLGIFRNNIFLSGEQYHYIFENNIEGKEYLLRGLSYHTKENANSSIIIFNKFQGDLDPQFHKYTGNGLYSSYSYIYNAKKDRYEPNISYIYNGNFINGKENGDGVLKKSIHSAKYSFIYKGVFQNGEMDGYGVIQYTQNFFLRRYEGFFNKGKKFFLYGKVEFKSGDIYEGFFDSNYLKDYIGLYIHGEKNNQIVNDNYFGFFKKDKKHGLGRFISMGLTKKEQMYGKYTIGEKQGPFQITIEELIRDSNLDLISFDLLEDNSEFNILTLATRKKRGIANSQFYGIRSKKKKKTKKNFNMIKIRQKKIYYFFENDDILDKSDKPFDI